MTIFEQRIAQALSERKANGLDRTMVSFERKQGDMLALNGRQYLNFSSNDYLGLATDPELAAAWQDGLSRYGCGSAASPLVTGFQKPHRSLEARLCEWLGYERAILFSSGFSANQAVLFSLLNKDDVLLQDRLNHASLMEAGALCPARMKRFRHNDMTHLQQLITPDDACFVVTEGVFSMDGDHAPLKAIRELTTNRALMMVDDAHGIGVVGADGSGSCAAGQVKADLLLVTFGKAFGLSGAALLCDKTTGDYLTQFARHHVYSTAIPPSQAHALCHAVHMIQTQQWRRDKLQYLQQCYDEAFSPFAGYVRTPTPIKPLILGETACLQTSAAVLREKGFWPGAIRPPTVPEGTARLRITLTVNHTEIQIHQLASALNESIEASCER
ncbi:8-amino-7-oxononanoate synthase [Vibrio quintilis]|uniref:8-amino-7-oxononanoate synthase n=1 Tax=Vibrio quintilis TaxID=1117707 RepID=A0A1M7Z124_9VIBR|nr:8-amino-7-oxononanoate synthase [Vibrio quintilis]SHO58545.1 8-amino-7-oxononanoate synthase [Vibrio quintilis]